VSHVFLSYVREDAVQADRLADELILNGVEVWMDRLSIKPGERWDLAIREAVRSGDFFIACFSESSTQKARSGMNQELALAVDELMMRPLNRRWFIPVLLSPCEVPEYSLGGGATLKSIQHILLFENWRQGTTDILDVVAPDRRRDDSAHKRRERLRNLIREGSDMTDNDIGTIQTIVDSGREAVPIIVETLANPPSQFQSYDFGLLIYCLGQMGSMAAPAVPSIVDYAQRINKYDYDVVDSLGSIGSARAREVDFVVDVGGQLELFEAKWTELPSESDAVNLDFVREAVGKAKFLGGAVVCRTPNTFPLADGFRALPVSDLG
jgi:TIR domain